MLLKGLQLKKILHAAGLIVGQCDFVALSHGPHLWGYLELIPPSGHAPSGSPQCMATRTIS